MKIAVIGWGSIVWDPKDLQLLDPAWHPDGPLLPIELGRKSDSSDPRNRLTLVLSEGVQRVRTFWAESACDDLDVALENLALREKITRDDLEKSIGYVKENDGRLSSISDSGVTDELQQWRRRKGLDAVIWTDLASDFPGRHPTPELVVGYLRELREKAEEAATERYVRRAPLQIRTEIRKRIEEEFGWLPRRVEPAPLNPSQEARMKEWAECRTTIGRFDNILADLRKFGFSLITGLLTASAFLGVGAKDGFTLPANARASALIAIMVLIALLFSVDSYYQVMLSAAVERALDLETKTDPWVRVSKYLSVNAKDTLAVYVTLLLYLVLLATAVGLGVLTAGGLGLGLWANGPMALFQSANTKKWYWGLAWIAGIVLLLVVVRRLRGSRSAGEEALGTGDWVAFILKFVAAALFTAGPCLLMSRAKGTAAAWWVIGLGTVLATYMETYWLYVALRSGWHRDKPARTWPEGKLKVA